MEKSFIIFWQTFAKELNEFQNLHIFSLKYAKKVIKTHHFCVFFIVYSQELKYEKDINCFKLDFDCDRWSSFDS